MFLRVQGLRFRVRGLEFRVLDVRFRVYCSGFWAFRSFRAQGFACFGFQSWGGFKDLLFSKNEAALDFPVWLGECKVQGLKFYFSSFYVLFRYPGIAPINTHPIIPI